MWNKDLYYELEGSVKTFDSPVDALFSLQRAMPYSFSLACWGALQLLNSSGWLTVAYISKSKESTNVGSTHYNNLLDRISLHSNLQHKFSGWECMLWRDASSGSRRRRYGQFCFDYSFFQIGTYTPVSLWSTLKNEVRAYPVLQTTSAIYMSLCDVNRTYILRERLPSERETEFVYICMFVYVCAHDCWLHMETQCGKKC